MIKFVSVKVRNRFGRLGEPGPELLYLAEAPVKVGDYVRVPLRGSVDHGEVVAVGTTREKVGSDYNGSVESVQCVVDQKEKRAIQRVERAEVALAKAHEALQKLPS